MKPCDHRIGCWKTATRNVVMICVFLVALPAVLRAAAPQTETDVSPEATPEIRQVKPGQAGAGDEVTVIIEGKNFSAGAYVSFSTPAVHAIATKRGSATQLESRVTVGKKAEAGTVSLFVSNPASSVAEAPFTITGGAAPAEAPASRPAEAPAPPTPLPAQASSLVPAASAAQPAASVPEVTSVDPNRAGKGCQLELKIHGKNFVKGAKVSFSNPGIRVFETQVTKDSELTARIQIADDAATGSSGLFVVNPDDNETEAAFVVTDEAPTTTAAAASTPAAAGAPSTPASASAPAVKTEGKGAAESAQFEVISLADVAGILQKGNRPKGMLTIAASKLRYEESGKEVFAVASSDIKEVSANTFLGVNTGTFHVILNSGQTYNFIASSLRPADSQSIIDALRKVMK